MKKQATSDSKESRICKKRKAKRQNKRTNRTANLPSNSSHQSGAKPCLSYDVCSCCVSNGTLSESGCHNSATKAETQFNKATTNFSSCVYSDDVSTACSEVSSLVHTMHATAISTAESTASTESTVSSSSTPYAHGTTNNLLSTFNSLSNGVTLLCTTVSNALSNLYDSTVYSINNYNVNTPTIDSTASKKNRGKRPNANQRRTAGKRQRAEQEELDFLFSPLSTQTRKRKKNNNLLRYFPRDIMNMTNAGVHNLTLPEYALCDTPRPLSNLERIVLALGPQFIIYPPALTIPKIKDVYNNFERTLRNKYYFSSTPSNTSACTKLDKLTKLPSLFVPPRASTAVESYLTYVRTNLFRRRVIHSKNTYPNAKAYHSIKNKHYNACATRRIIVKTISQLLSDTSVVFKKSDKNLGLAVMPSIWYEQQAMSHLLDAATYSAVPTLPTVASVFDQLRTYTTKHAIPLQVINFIYHAELTCVLPLTTNIPLANFYLLPKIHKTPISTRPIVASIKAVTYNTSKYVDFVLQPVMRSFKQVLQSPVDLLRHLNITSFPANCCVCTADVTSLYPSIDIYDGLQKLSAALVLYNTNFKGDINVELIVCLCKWVLQNNYMSFGNTVWVQLCGTAMGTPLAVSFANIYLAMLEKDMFSMYYLVYPKTLEDSILLFVRFIDDILCVTQHRDHCNTVIDFLNSMHKNIRLTHTISNTTVDFLDLTIYKGSLFSSHSKLFDVKPYQKPMNAYLYIPPFSHHNPAVFKSFIQSEIRRYTRNSTDPTISKQLCLLLYGRLLARGYSATFLDDVMSVKYNRNDILFPREALLAYGTRYTQYYPRPAVLNAFNPPLIAVNSNQSVSSVSPLLFKVPYTPAYTNKLLADILKYDNYSAHSLLHDHMLHIPTSHHHPIVCYQRTESIGDKLISAKYVYDFPF